MRDADARQRTRNAAKASTSKRWHRKTELATTSLEPNHQTRTRACATTPPELKSGGKVEGRALMVTACGDLA